jgi:hypothetical protein
MLARPSRRPGQQPASSSGVEVGQQLLDPGANVVAYAAHDLDGLARRVGQVPVFIAFARKDGQVSPQPMVTTTSLSRAVA